MEETRKLIICRGIQGSGKTTWAKQWCHEDPEHRVRFNNDDIRNMLGKYWVPSREGLIKDLKGLFLWEAMSYGFDIVIDNMNLNPKILPLYTKLVNKIDDSYEIIVEKVNTPLEVCLERDKKRENPIGTNVIINIYNIYKDILNSNTDI